MSDTTLKKGAPSGVQQAVHDAHILVVDDMDLMRKMIGMCLTRGGFSNITFAGDGDQALEAIREKMPDLVILDLNMPTLSGYEVCRRLRADEKTKHLPILVQSASETAEERVEVFAVGATDFVSKPINHPELLARVRMHLQNRFLISSLSDFRSRMESELNMARDMQESLLPEGGLVNNIETAADGKLEAIYQASSELGGDLWGGWVLPGDKVGLYVLDVSGHGVGAALNTFSLHATMARYDANKEDPADFLLNLNKSLANIFPTGQFATMFYGVLDCGSGKLTYAGAGAPPPFIVGADGVRTLDSSGLPIGIVSSATYENLEEYVNPGESLFCYSDVLLEAKGQGDTFLGEDGLRQLIMDLASSGERETIVERAIAQFRADRDEQLPDDLTAIALHRRSLVAETQKSPSSDGDVSESHETFNTLVTPIVVAVGDWTDADFDVLSLSGKDMHVVHAPDIEDLEKFSIRDTARLSAFVLRDDVGDDVFTAAINSIDQDFMRAGGPIFVLTETDDAPLKLENALNVPRSFGLKAFRRQLSQSVADFIRIEALKRELAGQPMATEPISQSVFQFRTRQEAQKLATILSLYSPSPVPVAIGLSELFLNAIEHGCLGIGHDEKGELIDQGLLEQEIESRLTSPEYQDRFATVEFSKDGNEFTFTVQDPGDGFDHLTYMSDQEGHTKKHGRGIVMAKGCFTTLSYTGNGNTVRAVFLAPPA